jgi:hypothetical protein
MYKAQLSVAGSEGNKGRECVLVFWSSAEHFKTDIEVEFQGGAGATEFVACRTKIHFFCLLLLVVGTNWLDKIRRTTRLCRTTALHQLALRSKLKCGTKYEMVPVAAYFNTKEVPCHTAASRSILCISSDVALRA